MDRSFFGAAAFAAVKLAYALIPEQRLGVFISEGTDHRINCIPVFGQGAAAPFRRLLHSGPVFLACALNPIAAIGLDLPKGVINRGCRQLQRSSPSTLVLPGTAGRG